MDKSKPIFGKLMQKKVKSGGFFSRSEKSPQNCSGILPNEKCANGESQPMDCTEQASTPNSTKISTPFAASPRYAKHGLVKQVLSPNQEYWHPIFVGTPSERSSSAPVSPVSGYNSPTPLLEPVRINNNSNPLSGHRQPPPVTIYRSARSRGLHWRPPDTHRRGLSPHQSEMSLSAPSSPGNGSSCYEKVSINGFYGEMGLMEDELDEESDYDRPYRRPWASNFEEAFRRQRRLRMTQQGSGHHYHHHHSSHHYHGQSGHQTSNYRSHRRRLGESQDLLGLLKKLGLESLHQLMLQHGFARIDQLGGLTRQRLIDMGVTSAEVRASLLTAAQLLTNSRIETPVSLNNQNAENCSTWNRTPTGLYASGDIIFPRPVDFWLLQGPSDQMGQEIDPRIPQPVSGNKLDPSVSEAHFGIRKHFPGIQKNENFNSQRSNSLGPKFSNDSKVTTPTSQPYDMTSSNISSLKNTFTTDVSQLIKRPKAPVGILRKTSMLNPANGNANLDGFLNGVARRRMGSTPKSVKIDESSLQHQTASPNCDDLGSVIAEQLRMERIDLTKPPYSNANGESGIPLRLVDRYAEELEKDFMTVALAFESLRELSLKAAGLNFKPNYDDIRTQRYLNCVGIKTGNLADFLTTIGLPMYADRLVAAIGLGDVALPANLAVISDAQMVYGLDIPLCHVRRIRTEAGLIPKSLLSTNSSSMPRGGGGGLTKQMIFRKQQQQHQQQQQHGHSNHQHHHSHHSQKQQQQMKGRQKGEVPSPILEIVDKV